MFSSGSPHSLHFTSPCPSSFRSSSTEAGCRRAPWINDISFLSYRSQIESELSFTLADTESGHQEKKKISGAVSRACFPPSPSKAGRLLCLQSPVTDSILLFSHLCILCISSEMTSSSSVFPNCQHPQSCSAGTFCQGSASAQHPMGQPHAELFGSQGGSVEELGTISRSHKVRAHLKGAGTAPALQVLLILASQNPAK